MNTPIREVSDRSSPAASRPDVSSYREDFPILRRKVASGADLVYLDNAASTQRPRAVIDAIDDCYTRIYANVHRGIHTLSEEATASYERARQIVAAFIGVDDPAEVIFTAGTTASINAVAHSWGRTNLNSGDVILLPISEHHANIVPWQQLCQSIGCRMEWIPIDKDYLIADEVVADLLRRYSPKLFVFAAASNTLGTHYPVARWTKLAHAAGASVLVDAAQAAPHQRVDVKSWDADFVVFSGHKVCGPTGIGVLYGKRQWLEQMPPFLGGGGMIHQVTTSGFTPARLPEKFEAGTPPIAQAIGLAAAIEYLQGIGMDRIEAHERHLCQIADAGLRPIQGLRIIGPTPDRKCGIVSFVIDGMHPHDLAQALDIAGIAVRAGHHCTMPLHNALGIPASCRASFYLYNTVAEAHQLVDVVSRVAERFFNRRSRRTRGG